MTLKQILIINFLFWNSLVFSQSVCTTYKINNLLERIQSKDTIYVLNFWATWCKPCVQELPSIDSLNALSKNSNTKVLLVCLDFAESLQSKVIPFLMKKNIQSECVLLDEINGNDYINKISESWSGAIPTTYFKSALHQILVEKKMNLKQLQEHLTKVRKE